MSGNMKVVIIDDEKKARDGIRLLLSQHPEIKITGEAKNGKEAIELIRKLRPDLIFLDIQMPGINGFDVLNSIKEEEWPIVIFTTAYDQYALKAFEVHALDYLLKPLHYERFKKSLDYAKAYHYNLSTNELGAKLRMLLEDYQSRHRENTLINTQKQNEENQVIIKSSGKIHFLDLEEIYWIEAMDSYVKIHLANKFHVIKSSLKALEKRFGNAFMRVHRSHLVNRSKISTMEPYFNGDFYLILDNNTKVKGSRNFKQNLPRAL